ncbi:MAG: hypothetical protein ABSF37_12520 [Sedimentisphaerales bacterium]|jgi:hypothetical protein
MKMLKVWVVVLVLLAVSTPSFGYILVYNALSRIKAIDSVANSLVGIAVRGYLILDINDTDGDVDASYWLIYGKDGDGTKVYTWAEPDQLQLSVSGKCQSVSMDTEDGWSITVVGKITNKAIGLAAGKQLIAYSMSGNLIIPMDGGVVLNDNQSLTGSGTISITLNSTKTKAANLSSEEIDDVLQAIQTSLVGYSG